MICGASVGVSCAACLAGVIAIADAHAGAKDENAAEWMRAEMDQRLA